MIRVKTDVGKTYVVEIMETVRPGSVRRAKQEPLWEDKDITIVLPGWYSSNG